MKIRHSMTLRHSILGQSTFNVPLWHVRLIMHECGCEEGEGGCVCACAGVGVCRGLRHSRLINGMWVCGCFESYGTAD